MLKEIVVKNYKSIRNEQLFTMEAAPESEISEFPKHLIKLKNGTDLLKVASIYGPNGGGKSNLLMAIWLLKIITRKTHLNNDLPENKTYTSSIFSNSNDVFITAIFENDECEIGYSIIVDLENSLLTQLNENTITINIKREEMSYKDKAKGSNMVSFFERSEDGIVTSNFLDIDLVNKRTALSKDNSFLNYVFTSFRDIKNDPSLVPILNLAKELSNILPLSRDIRTPYTSGQFATLIEPILPKITKQLNKLDFRIKNIKFVKNNQQIDRYDLYVERLCKDGIITSLPIVRESSGTRKFISLLLDIYTDKNPSIFLADDIDAFLHPKLVRCLIDLFNSEENQNKQLIMNSHDIINMNNEVFRRDEIWFAYRDEEYSSIYVPLSNIVNYKGEQIRKDAKYGKQYLEGRYGADPFIRHGLNWGEND